MQGHSLGIVYSIVFFSKFPIHPPIPLSFMGTQSNVFHKALTCMYSWKIEYLTYTLVLFYNICFKFKVKGSFIVDITLLLILSISIVLIIYPCHSLHNTFIDSIIVFYHTYLSFIYSTYIYSLSIYYVPDVLGPMNKTDKVKSLLSWSLFSQWKRKQDQYSWVRWKHRCWWYERENIWKSYLEE